MSDANRYNTHESARQVQRAFRFPRWLDVAVTRISEEIGVSKSEFIKTALKDKLRDDFGVTEATQFNENTDVN